MALSKPVPNAGDEIDLKIHYLYYNKNRVSPISIEFTELMSLGYIGLEAVIQSQIKYISRMPTLRMSYKDKKRGPFSSQFLKISQDRSHIKFR